MLLINHALKQHLIDNHAAEAGQDDAYYRRLTGKLVYDDKITIKQLRDLTGIGPTMQEITDAAGGDGADTVQVRVKKASELYSKQRQVARHKSLGEPVTFVGRPVETPSQLQLAKAGAWFKHLMNADHNAKTLRSWNKSVPQLTDHDRQLLAEMYNEDRFVGTYAGNKEVMGQTIKELKLDTKSLLSDSASGGSALTPFEFDDMVVTYPLLHSEILPHVTMRDTVRDEVQTAAISNATAIWNQNEGTPISLFDTSSMVSLIQENVRPVTVGILYGRDLEADSPVDLGAILVETIGQSLMQELDKVVFIGDGTTQPEGIFNASGVTSVNSDNGASGPPTLNDYLSLMFAVDKQYRSPAFSPAFLSNDTVYLRSRNIQVDPADPSTDQRPIFGLSAVNSYMTLEWPHKILNTGDLANTKIGFAALKKYRLWRRSAFQFELTNEGHTLRTRNENLLVARGRYAGTLVDVNAAAIIEDAQS